MHSHTNLPVSLPEICAPREELLRLIEHAAEKQIVCIQAPGGHGKTVSTLLWLRKTGRRAAWHSFDEYDNTPALFYAKFCRLLLSVLPHDESLENIVNAASFREAPVEFTMDILTKAGYIEEQIVIVMDDFHTIDNKAIVKSFPYVLKRLPENILVFLLSRSELPDTFGILHRLNKTAMIDSRELAFSVDEIVKHTANHGRFITEREAEALRVYSDGWAILLNTMLAGGQMQFNTWKSKLSYKSFFEKNIWNNFDAEKQRFLMKLALPDEFTIELCEILTRVDDCKSYIDALLRGNANISLSGEVYRYHDLFREYLLEKLQKSDIDKPELYKKTAQYHFSKNDYMTARRYAIRSNDVAVIAESTKRLAEEKNFSLDEYVEFSKASYEEDLSEAVCEKLPFLYVPKVLFYFLVGNAAKFGYFLDKLKASLPTLAKIFPHMLENALICCALDYRIKTSDILTLNRSLLDVAHATATQQASTTSFNLPFLHRSGRDFYELANHELLKAVMDEVLHHYLKENIDCYRFAVHGGLCIEQNKLAEAAEAFLEARGALTEKVSPEIGYAIFLGLAETAMLNGDKTAYEQHLNEAMEYVEGNKAYYLKRNLWAYEARAGLSNGDKKVAERWLSNYFVDNASLEAPYKAYQNLTTARAHIVLSDYGAAFDVSRAVKKMAESFNRPFDAAESDVLMSITSWMSGKKKEAVDSLYGQLAFLRTHDFIRVVANEGKDILPILSAVTNRLDKEPNKDEEMKRFVRNVYLAAYEQSKRSKGMTNAVALKAVKLSRQQALVLELLSKGHPNAQIVKITGLSLNTIRHHSKALYKKLDVTNVLDAIVKGKQLGFLK